jgi:hypothetical protein
MEHSSRVCHGSYYQTSPAGPSSPRVSLVAFGRALCAAAATLWRVCIRVVWCACHAVHRVNVRLSCGAFRWLRRLRPRALPPLCAL